MANFKKIFFFLFIIGPFQQVIETFFYIYLKKNMDKVFIKLLFSNNL